MAAGDVSHSTTTVSTSAQVVADPPDDVAGYVVEACISNDHASNDLFIGGAGVSSSAYGRRIRAGGAYVTRLGAGQQVWGVGSAAGTTVAVLYVPVTVD